MSYEKALRLLDIISDTGIAGIDIMGGEPLLVKWISDFVRLALNRNISVNISSNGSLPNIMQKFSGLNPDKFRIGISLEASGKTKHNSITNSAYFDNTVLSIKKLVRAGLNPIVKTVVTRNSLDDIQHIIDLLKDLGVKKYYLLHMDVLSRDGADLNESLSFIEFMDFFNKFKEANHDISILKVNASCFEKNSIPVNSRCAGGVKKFAVFPDGSAFPCHLFHHMEDFRLGNIFEDKFEDIWMNPKLNFFRKHKENNCSIEACSNRDTCTGSCPAHGYFHYGDPDMPDIRCKKMPARNILFGVSSQIHRKAGAC